MQCLCMKDYIQNFMHCDVPAAFSSFVLKMHENERKNRQKNKLTTFGNSVIIMHIKLIYIQK